MRKAYVLAVALSMTPLACGGSRESARTREAKNAAANQPVQLYLDDPNAEPDDNEIRPVGMDDGPVPKFRVKTVDGRLLDSAVLVGNEPFIVFFFATWCSMCDQKMPHVRRALEVTGPVKVIGVSLDEASTSPHAAGYLRERGINVPLVRASDYPRFALSYNPFSMVPLVVIVGRNGGLVDFQMGYAENDRERLIAAVQLARTIGPLAQPRERRPAAEPAATP